MAQQSFSGKCYYLIYLFLAGLFLGIVIVNIGHDTGVHDSGIFDYGSRDSSYLRLYLLSWNYHRVSDFRSCNSLWYLGNLIDCD